MRRLLAISGWLLTGAALSSGVYWGFLVTPESSVPALIVSAGLSLVTLILIAITINAASLAWSLGWSGVVVRRAIGRIPAFVAGAIVAGAIWWLTGLVTTRVAVHSGEISAWFIARAGWADATPFFKAVTWAGRWLQWVVGPLLGLSLVGSLLIGEWRSARWRWIGRGLSPFRLTLATLWFGAFIFAPWVYLVPWRPRGLPPTSLEVVFVAAKLGVVALLAAVGAALVVRESVPPHSEG